MILTLTTMVTRLASLNRFSMERLSAPDTVLEHTGAVALMSYVIGLEVCERGVILDLGCVLERAVVHDVDELVTGDVARPTKHASPRARQLFEELSSAAIVRVSDDLRAAGLPSAAEAVENVFPVAKSGREGAIVALADILAVVCKVWEEVILRGNMSMVRQAHSARRGLVQFERRIADEFHGDASTFLSTVVSEAIGVCVEAIARDTEWNATKAERYNDD